MARSHRSKTRASSVTAPATESTSAAQPLESCASTEPAGDGTSYVNSAVAVGANQPGNDQAFALSTSPVKRRLLSLFILFHITAVFIAPFTFASSPEPGVAPASPLAMFLMKLFQPYIAVLYLDHGYAFFAPDPGPSHLFRAHLEYDDERPDQVLTFPDRRQQWPRLLYHRHFMLSERLNDGYRPPVAPPGIKENPAQLAIYRQSRWDYEAYYQTLSGAYRRHLRTRYGANRAWLVRVEHRLLYPDEVALQGRKINEASLFVENPEDQPQEPQR